jgi:ankyrin repeat protein
MRDLFRDIKKNSCDISHKIRVLSESGELNKSVNFMYDGFTLLHYAVYYQNYEIIKILLEKNPDIQVNIRSTSCGSTPLHYLNSHNFFFTSKKFILDTVKILLDYGADVYIKNNDGQTCLDILSKIEYYDEIKKLIDDHTCFDIKGALD